MVADHWFMQVEKVLEAMEITSDTTNIRLATFQLEGKAQLWWNWVKTSGDLEAMTWTGFYELFMSKYFSGHCETCESLGVPRAEVGGHDRD